MSKRNPEEILKVLEEQGLEDDMREIVSMSQAELDTELRRAGLNPKQAVASIVRPPHLRADAPASVPPNEAVEPEAWVSAAPPAAARTVPRRWALLLAATFCAAAVGSVPIVVQVLAHRHDKDLPSPDAPTPSAKPSPQQIREAALAACRDRDWSRCLQGLNAARDLDPAGDSDPRVQAARQRAVEATTERRDPSHESKPKPR